MATLTQAADGTRSVAERLNEIEKRLVGIVGEIDTVRGEIPRPPDPRHDRLEWEGLVGRRAIMLAAADTIREEIADLASDTLPGIHCDRLWALLPWCDRLMQLAELPADPRTDFSAEA